MKRLLHIITLLTLRTGFILLIFQAGCTPGRKVNKQFSKEDMIAAIRNDQWIFTADVIMPQFGRSRNVNGNYDVQFSKDTITVYLPYIGRSYAGADVMNNQGPLNFQTGSFTFTKEKNKKGSWDIIIRPKDNSQVQSLSFNLFEEGSAQLTVILTNRSPVSFSGSIKPAK